ncbi:MAG: YgjV family protein [Clostridia bacterium]|nr:YgjV family protein [Clostridia bacterium]
MGTMEMASQVINLIGSSSNILGINFKEKRKTLICFIIGNILISTSLGLLHAWSGMIVQALFVTETIINYFYEKHNDESHYNIWVIIVYIIAPLLVLLINFQSMYDLFVIFAGVLFPLSIVAKDFNLRLLNFIAVMLWIPYNFHFAQYAGAIMSTIFAIVNLIAIIRYDILKDKRKI